MQTMTVGTQCPKCNGRTDVDAWGNPCCTDCDWTGESTQEPASEPLEKPSLAWSPRNQMIMLTHGTEDARGYRQWQAAGRQVRKGAKSFKILVPRVKKDKQSGEIIGRYFAEIPVFRIEDTEPIQ